MEGAKEWRWADEKRISGRDDDDCGSARVR